jgi:hypothetical protein
VQNRLKEHQIYFSREIPAAEKRRQMIDNYISTLLDHPMAFFEHFNQTLSPEVFKELFIRNQSIRSFLFFCIDI